MKLLGLRLCEHDSNMSYYDGNIVRYVKFERNYQEKHLGLDNLNSWKWEIEKHWGITEQDIDQVCVILDPWRHGLPFQNFNIHPHVIYPRFPSKIPVKIQLSHHYAHSLSTFPLYSQPTDIDIVIDGRGDPNVSWSVIKKGKLIDVGNLKQHGSIGQIIETIGRIGFDMSSCDSNACLDNAGKIMGLQSYGKLDKKFLDSLEPYSIYDAKLFSSFDLWVYHKGDEKIANLTLLDWIHTLHFKFEQVILDLFKKYCSPNDVISYTGGVAQNVIWNTRLKNNFPNLIVPPHCNDDGLSLGAIEYLRQLNNLPQISLKNFPYIQSDESPKSSPSINTIKKVAKLLIEGKTIGWYQGNGEIGPRALGNRSILFNPLIPNGKEIVNKIKKRENYRPFGATVLEEKAKDYFDFNYPKPHMLYTGKVKDSRLKSVTHVDGTCRFQTVNEQQNPYYYKLIQEFEKLSGVPVLLNTSLNVNRKPIAGYKDNAYELFYNSELDYLVIGDKIISK